MLRTMFFAAMAAVTLPGVMAICAMADSPHMALHHRHKHAAHHALSHAFIPGPPVIRGQGYIYVPRVGVIDEACNLPASACPNEKRDVQ
jgi:hypothetical protein